MSWPFRRRRRLTRVVVAGSIDVGTAPSLARMVGDLAGDERVDVLLDLGRVTYLDPAGLAALHRAGAAFPGRLSVRPPAGGAARHFVDSMGVDALLPAAA